MRQNKENNARIGDYIKAFCALKGNRAIYFPSYQILETYAGLTVPHIRGRKIFIEPRDAADAGAALFTFLSLPAQGESGILFAVCGGKWSEGLDYRGEMLNGAMVIGLPLAPFNRVRKMMIEYFRHKFGEEGEFLCYTLPGDQSLPPGTGESAAHTGRPGCTGAGREKVPGKTGTYSAPCMDPKRDDRVRCSTVPGVDFTVEIVGGACRFGLWFVQVWWNGTTVHRVRFATTGIPGEVPDLIRKYCAGQVVSLQPLNSSAVSDDTVYSRIYRVVQQVPYGSHVNIWGDCGQSRDIPPRSRSGNGTQSHTPCHSLPPYPGGS